MIWFAVIFAAYILLEAVLKVIAIGSVPENRRPSSSTAWLLLILLLPVVGFPLYWTIGSPYVRGRRALVQKEANHLIAERTADQPQLHPGLKISESLRGIVAMNHRLTAMPCTSGSVDEVYDNATALYQAMAKQVDAATDVVHVENYIVTWDQTTDVLFTAMANARARGVKVRFLLDHLGSRKYPHWGRFKKQLTEVNIDWHLMMPLLPWRGRWRRPDLRNHRKLVVVDGKVGFVGSHNLIDPSYDLRKNLKAGRTWQDLSVRVSGRIVHQVEAVFATDWYAETGVRLDPLFITELDENPPEPGGLQLVPSGPGFPTEPNRHQFVELMHHAVHRMTVTSPYFVPDESLLAAIIGAAYRGVDVKLFVSEKADQFLVNHAQRSYYQALLEAGVRIFLYPAPTVLHAKYFTIDENIGVIGSSNMDFRSFALNYEIMLLGVNGSLARILRENDKKYRAICHELTLEEWAQRGWFSHYVDNACRLTSALM